MQRCHTYLIFIGFLGEDSNVLHRSFLNQNMTKIILKDEGKTFEAGCCNYG